MVSKYGARNKCLQARNKALYEAYIVYLNMGMPVMLIYAQLGEEYQLSEYRVRYLVSQIAHSK